MYEARFSPVSNRADWLQGLELVNDDTGEVIADLDGVSIRIDLREVGEHCARLTASTENGKITDQGDGLILLRVPRSEMTGLPAGSYEIGVTMERDDFTTQFIIGTVPIVDGIVQR